MQHEIYEVIATRGRVSTHELSQCLNIYPEQIEQQLMTIKQQQQSGLWFVDDREVMTEYHIDKLTEEIDRQLQHRLQLSISSLTLKYNLPPVLLAEVISTRIPHAIRGELLYEKTILAAFGYNNILKAQVRGILRACVRPVPIDKLRKRHRLHDLPLVEVIDELIQEGAVEGQVQGGCYVSSKFTRDQKTILQSFFKQNEYIEYDYMTKNLCISSPKDFLSELFS